MPLYTRGYGGPHRMESGIGSTRSYNPAPGYPIADSKTPLQLPNPWDPARITYSALRLSGQSAHSWRTFNFNKAAKKQFIEHAFASAATFRLSAHPQVYSESTRVVERAGFSTPAGLL